MGGKHRKEQKVEIVKGVRKGVKGRVIQTREDEYGEHLMIRTEKGSIITPIDPDNVKKI